MAQLRFVTQTDVTVARATFFAIGFAVGFSVAFAVMIIVGTALGL